MRPLAPCGTDSAYQRHKKRREVACDSCKKAHSEYMAEQRADNPKLRAREMRRKLARERALSRLASEYPRRYEELRIEELRANS